MTKINSLNLFFSVLSQSSYGEIEIRYYKTPIYNFTAIGHGPKVTVNIKDFKCIDNFFLKGDLGWAESYIQGLRFTLYRVKLCQPRNHSSQ